jgi:hypothetical protein
VTARTQGRRVEVSDVLRSANDTIDRLTRERDEAVALLRHLGAVLAVTHPMAAELAEGWLPKDSAAGHTERQARKVASRLDDNRMTIRALLARIDGGV